MPASVIYLVCLLITSQWICIDGFFVRGPRIQSAVSLVSLCASKKAELNEKTCGA